MAVEAQEFNEDNLLMDTQRMKATDDAIKRHGKHEMKEAVAGVMA